MKRWTMLPFLGPRVTAAVPAGRQNEAGGSSTRPTLHTDATSGGGGDGSGGGGGRGGGGGGGSLPQWASRDCCGMTVSRPGLVVKALGW